MKHRRKNEDESSLELLLDTMCNTFGGVMFIAISIFVISLNLVQQQPSSPTAPVDPAALQSQIDSIRIMLEELQIAAQLKKEAVQLKKLDESQRKQHELLMAMQLVKELEIKNSVLESAIKKAQQPLDQAKMQRNKLAHELNLQKISNNQKHAELMTMQNKLSELNQHKASQLELAFKLIQPSAEAPFFIILHGTQIWPVGPWQQANHKDQVDEAVSSSEFTNGKLLVVSCQRKPGYGIEVLENNQLSGAFTALLQKIPHDRVPKFFVHPNSAAVAFRMREILKNKNIKHGCTLAASDNEDFKYQYTPNVAYEY